MRLFWVGVGAAAAVAVVYQIGRAKSAADSVARTMTPEGFSDAVTRGVNELRDIAREISAAMSEQESRLTEEFLPDPQTEASARTTRAARSAAPRPATDPWGGAEI